MKRRIHSSRPAPRSVSRRRLTRTPRIHMAASTRVESLGNGRITATGEGTSGRAASPRLRKYPDAVARRWISEVSRRGSGWETVGQRTGKSSGLGKRRDRSVGVPEKVQYRFGRFPRAGRSSLPARVSRASLFPLFPSGFFRPCPIPPLPGKQETTRLSENKRDAIPPGWRLPQRCKVGREHESLLKTRLPLRRGWTPTPRRYNLHRLPRK